MTDREAPKTLSEATKSASLVTRSVVPSGLPYPKYKPYLQRDFFYSCAYCTICESEATAIRLTIDHYEPKTARPDLVNDYSNLMYACDCCNQRKGNRCPPPSARAAGIRFFRPDNDLRTDHFQLNGMRLDAKSEIGDYSIEAIDLNRLELRKLRDLRQRLTKCDELVAEGVLALRRFHIDQLPTQVKGNAARTIAGAIAMADRMAERIDALLLDYARSPLSEADPESEKHAMERGAKLNNWKTLYPGSWRAPQGGPKKPAQQKK